MIIQLTDKHYHGLLARAGVKDPQTAEGILPLLKQVHRLLAVDGREAHTLTPREQELAKVFEGMKLAVVEDVTEYGVPTGNLIPAVDMPVRETHVEGPPADSAPSEQPEPRTKGRK